MGRPVVGAEERLDYVGKDCDGNIIHVIEYLEYKRVLEEYRELLDERVVDALENWNFKY